MNESRCVMRSCSGSRRVHQGAGHCPHGWASRVRCRPALLWLGSRPSAERSDNAPRPKPMPTRQRSSLMRSNPLLKELLAKYPNLTVVSAPLQELQARDFQGRYTIVRQRLRLLQPRAPQTPVGALETGPGMQARKWILASMTSTSRREGRRRVYLFSYLLGYSAAAVSAFRQPESMDLPPRALREHLHAFQHLGGAARICPVRQLQGRGLYALRLTPELGLVQPQVPRLRHALRLQTASLPGAAAANEREKWNASSSMSKPAYSTVAPSKRWSISMR